MPTVSNIRGNIDMSRLRQALAGPGADPRSWVCFGLIEDDDDAITWDPRLGWIADVTMTSSELAGESMIPCLVAQSFVAGSAARTCPVRKGQGVIVVLPSGSLNANPIIVGTLFNDSNPPPTEVNGDSIDEEKAQKSFITVGEMDIDQQIDGFQRLVASGKATFAGSEVALGSENASQSFVKGEENKDAVSAFADATQIYFTAFVTALTNATPSIIIPPSAIQAFAQSVAQLKSGLTNALSSTIKGE